jgi:LmbE family N-acetylglucosaminyl deacetylase
VTRPAVILSPHLDDAVLSCWSVLTDQTPVTVVNVFAGVPAKDHPLAPGDRLTGAESSYVRALERVREDKAVLDALKRERVNLQFLAAQYRGHEQDVKPVVAAIVQSIGHPGMIYAPAGIGGHPDHMVTRAAATALMQRGSSVTLYAELPYCVEYGWPHWVSGHDPDPHLDVTFHWQQPLSLGEVSVEGKDAVIRTLSTGAQAAKLAALRAYRTQFSALDRRPNGILSSEGALAFEVFWPLAMPSLSRWRTLRYEVLWHLGARRGGRLERLSQRPGLRRLRPKAASRLGRFLRLRGTR